VREVRGVFIKEYFAPRDILGFDQPNWPGLAAHTTHPQSRADLPKKFHP